MVNFSKKRKSTGGSQYRPPKIFVAAKEDKRKPKESQPLWPRVKMVFYLIALLVGLYFVFASPLFKLKQILVEGNKSIPKEDVEKRFNLGTNLLLLSTKNAQKDLLNVYPQIQNVQIFKGIPDAIKIVIYEKEFKAVWETNGIRYYLSAHGEITKPVGDEKTDLPLIVDKQNFPVKPNQQIASPNFIAFITNISENLNKEVGINPNHYEVAETTFDVNLYTDAGFYVKLNALRSSKKQLENLKKVLAEKRPEIKEYVDLRIDGWAYYK